MGKDKSDGVSIRDIRTAVRIADIIRTKEYNGYMVNNKKERDQNAPIQYWSKCTTFQEEIEKRAEEKRILELD